MLQFKQISFEIPEAINVEVSLINVEISHTLFLPNFMRFFRKKEEKEYQYDWTIRELSEVLDVHKDSVRNHLARHKLYSKIKRGYYKDLIPQEIADRILGLKSNPPEDIDEIEYRYPLSWLYKKMDCSRYMALKKAKKKDLYQYFERNSYGIFRIPRSLCKLIYPYIGKKI